MVNSSPISLNKQLGNFIRLHRQAFNLSQAELARKAHTNQGAIARLEKGLGNPTLKTLTVVAKAMACRLAVDFYQPHR